jgi:hypothetical protein
MARDYARNRDGRGVCTPRHTCVDTHCSGTACADRGRTTRTSDMQWRVSIVTVKMTTITTRRPSHRRFLERVNESIMCVSTVGKYE